MSYVLCREPQCCKICRVSSFHFHNSRALLFSSIHVKCRCMSLSTHSTNCQRFNVRQSTSQHVAVYSDNSSHHMCVSINRYITDFANFHQPCTLLLLISFHFRSLLPHVYPHPSHCLCFARRTTTSPLVLLCPCRHPPSHPLYLPSLCRAASRQGPPLQFISGWFSAG